MSGCFGTRIQLAIFGESHGPAIGITVDGLPPGLKLDMDFIESEMVRRAPGQSALSTSRKEPDAPEILSGLLDGVTTGAPLCAVIRNTNQRSRDYGGLGDLVRPGHSDYTGHVRYFGYNDVRGGGHFSGRITAPLVFAGAICKQLLMKRGVEVFSHAQRLSGIQDESFLNASLDLEALRALRNERLAVIQKPLAQEMEQAILEAKRSGDSVGGVIECMALGLPAGLGAPFFDSVESVLSHMLFSVPAVKGVEFGLGFSMCGLRGSECNDAFAIRDGKVVTQTNRCGGILGGITTGMPLVFRVAVRPTASILREQQTVSLERMREEKLTVHGRHDPCIVPRAVPVIEAAAAIVLEDLLLQRDGEHPAE